MITLNKALRSKGITVKSVTTNSSGAAIFVRYNRVNLCTKMTNLTKKFVRYNRIFVKNRVRYHNSNLSANAGKGRFLLDIFGKF